MASCLESDPSGKSILSTAQRGFYQTFPRGGLFLTLVLSCISSTCHSNSLCHPSPPLELRRHVSLTARHPVLHPPTNPKPKPGSHPYSHISVRGWSPRSNSDCSSHTIPTTACRVSTQTYTLYSSQEEERHSISTVSRPAGPGKGHVLTPSRPTTKWVKKRKTNNSRGPKPARKVRGEETTAADSGKLINSVVDRESGGIAEDLAELQRIKQSAG